MIKSVLKKAKKKKKSRQKYSFVKTLVTVTSEIKTELTDKSKTEQSFSEPQALILLTVHVKVISLILDEHNNTESNIKKATSLYFSEAMHAIVESFSHCPVPSSLSLRGMLTR